MLYLAGALSLAAMLFVFMPQYLEKIPAHLNAKRLTFKAIPTAISAAFALVALIQSGFTSRYALLVTIALILCTGADVMLALRFVVGGGMFFFGHMFYITAFHGAHPLTWWSLPIFILASGALWLFLRRYKPLFPDNRMIYLVMTYALALGSLLAFSLPLPFLKPSLSTTLAAVGAVLFVLSDMGTCHHILAKAGVRFNYLSLGTYYTAQLLLALSTFN